MPGSRVRVPPFPPIKSITYSAPSFGYSELPVCSSTVPVERTVTACRLPPHASDRLRAGTARARGGLRIEVNNQGCLFECERQVIGIGADDQAFSGHAHGCAIETGLYYYRARYYSPALGRFLQTDPVGYQDDLNSYLYVHDDSLNRQDPSGLYTCEDGSEKQCDMVDAALPLNDPKPASNGWSNPSNRAWNQMGNGSWEGVKMW
jgi:RHS repeat-associated protein